MTDSVSVESRLDSAGKQTDSGIMEEANYLNNEEYEKFEQTDSDLTNLVTITETDPDHPFNWSLRKKLCHTLLFGLTTFCAQFCATIFAADVLALSEEFHVGIEVTTLSYCIYLLGNIPGPVFFAPLSELLGRRVGIMIPTFIAGCFVIITANVTSMWAVLVLRFVSGVFAAAPIVNAGGAMADMWQPKQRVAAIVLYAMMIVTGSVCGPLIGAALATTGGYGWRWSCWTGGLFTMLVSAFNWIMLSESFVPVLEGHKARQIRISTGRWAAHAKIDEFEVSGKAILETHFARPLMLFCTPIVFAITIYTSFVYALLFLLLGNVEELFVLIHHFTPVAATTPMFALMIGFFIGGVINVVNAMRYGKIAQKIRGVPPPEEFLGAMVVLGWVMPAGFFIYGWTFYADVHWIGPVIGLGVIGCGFAIIFQSCLVYLIAAYTKYAASALAANTIFRSTLAGSFPLFGRQMYNTLNPRWASSLLGFLCVAAIPIPWLFYYRGAQLRKINPFASRIP